MKKIFLLIVILLQNGILSAQERDNVGHRVGPWNFGTPQKGITWKIRRSYYSDNSENFTNEIEIKNTNNSTITFSYNISENANETTTKYRKTLAPNATYTSTYCQNAQFVYFFVDFSDGQTINKQNTTDNNAVEDRIRQDQERQNREIANKRQQYSSAFSEGTTAYNSGNYREAKTQFANALNFANSEQERAYAQDNYNKSVDVINRESKAKVITDVVQSTISGIDEILKASKAEKERKRLKAIQDNADKRQVEQLNSTNANNGDFDAQIKVAKKHFEDKEYALSEMYYKQAFQNSSKDEYDRNYILDELITTQILQDKTDDIYNTLDIIKKKNVSNKDAKEILTFIKLNCSDYCTDYIKCDDETLQEGINELKQIYKYSIIGNVYYAYLQVTGEYENFGIPKNEKIGLNTLEQLTSDEYSGYYEIAYYFLGMIQLKGTATIEINEKKALKCFLKGVRTSSKSLQSKPYIWRSDANNAFFSYKLLNYLKIAELYSKSTDNDDRELSKQMLNNFYNFYKGFIPNSDKIYFKEFSHIVELKKPIISTNSETAEKSNKIVDKNVSSNDDKINEANFAKAEQLYEDEKYQKALKLYEISANNGFVKSMYKCGLIYKNDKNIEHHKIALYWLEKAANSGDTDSMWCLGNVYGNGDIGLQIDNIKSFNWTKKAAENNNSVAMYNLGNTYEKGLLGIPQDSIKSKEWFKKSCDAGFPLGCMKIIKQ